jgi:hypothetical protein
MVDMGDSIRTLIVLGDNRLKNAGGSGGDRARAKARDAYEEALALAAEAGLDDEIRPLIELRLADLDNAS